VPAAAWVTIILALLTVVVLAAYLIRVALILRRVERSLATVIGGVGAIVDKTKPINSVLGEINQDLAGVDSALQEVLTRERSPLPPPWVVATPKSTSRQAASSFSPSPTPRSTAVQSRTATVEEPPGPDVVWGIRESVGAGGISKQFALIAGLVYVGIGVIGFFATGFNNFTEDTNEALFGLFHITPMHNIVHIGAGALLILAGLLLTRIAAEGVNFSVGAFLVVAAVLGYLGYLRILGIDPGFGDLDFYLHLATGVVALLFGGLIGSRQPEAAHARV